jgi:hypothetical protein
MLATSATATRIITLITTSTMIAEATNTAIGATAVLVLIKKSILSIACCSSKLSEESKANITGVSPLLNYY